MLKLRGHHLICTQFFNGHGYSFDFIENMKVIVDTIQNNPLLSIKLTTSCDSICAFCPSYKKNKCIKSDNIIEKDKLIINLLRLKENEIMQASELGRITREFLSRIDLIDICSKCQWFSICLEHHRTIY
ncbi:MAG: DUF1284 domain-containing protein [Halanaerobiaceae bacterium]